MVAQRRKREKKAERKGIHSADKISNKKIYWTNDENAAVQSPLPQKERKEKAMPYQMCAHFERNLNS